MKGHCQLLAFASALILLPLAAYSQNPSAPDSQNASQGPASGQHEASLMKPARARLVQAVDAHKDSSGQTIKAELDGKLTLTNGTELPRGTRSWGKLPPTTRTGRGKQSWLCVSTRLVLKTEPLCLSGRPSKALTARRPKARMRIHSIRRTRYRMIGRPGRCKWIR